MKVFLASCLSFFVLNCPQALPQSTTPDYTTPEYMDSLGKPPSVSQCMTWLKDKGSVEHRRTAAAGLRWISVSNRGAAKPAVTALTDALNDADPFVRLHAADALGNLGTEAKDAVPALEKGLKNENPESRYAAASVLWRISHQETALNVLLEPLKDESCPAEHRFQVVQALNMIGPSAKAAVPLLTELLKNKDEYLRVVAAQALWTIARKRIAISALIEALKSGESTTRGAAATTLGLLGSDAREAVPALVTALEDSQTYVRSSAASTLGQIGSDAVASVPALIKALGDSDSHVRTSAASSLGNIGWGAAVATPALLDSLKEADEELYQDVLIALVRIGAKHDKTVPLVVKRLNSTNVEIPRRFVMLLNLKSVGADAAPAVPALAGLLEDKSPHVRYCAYICLGEIGPPAKAVVPALEKALNDKDWSNRVYAALALWRIAKHPEAMSFLARNLESDDSRAVRGALECLAQIGPDAGKTAPRLHELLKARDEASVIGAAWALWQIEKYAQTVAILGKGLNSSDYLARFMSAKHLGEMGPQAKAAVPSLLKVINQGDYPSERDIVTEALRKIDPEALETLGQ
jgi:HEAT repeat protein